MTDDDARAARVAAAAPGWFPPAYPPAEPRPPCRPRCTDWHQCHLCAPQYTCLVCGLIIGQPPATGRKLTEHNGEVLVVVNEGLNRAVNRRTG